MTGTNKPSKLAYNRRAVEPSTFANQTPFRTAERKYKNKDRLLDLQDVFDYRCTLNNAVASPITDKEATTENDTSYWNKQAYRIQLHTSLRQSLNEALGDLMNMSDDSNIKQWDNEESECGFMIYGMPGFVLIPNTVHPLIQRRLVQKCYANYAKPPNLCNLSAHYQLPTESLWYISNNMTESVLDSKEDPLILLKESKEDDALYEEEDDKGAQLTLPLHLKPLPASQLIGKLRWCTLGMQYNWRTKTYFEDQQYTFPDELRLLTKCVANAVQNCWAMKDDDLGTPPHGLNLGTGYPGDRFEPEAGVVNFYGLKDALMGHVDRSEINMEAPLISLSLGSACVFLIGGIDKTVAPLPVLLRSGDIVVMFGESRRAYHSVPRIIEKSLPLWMEPDNEHSPFYDTTWTAFGEHLRKGHRVNINVRQVF